MSGRVRQWTKPIAALVALALLAGCWDQVDLQDVTFISAIGIDYAEGDFTLYAHVISPSSTAKKESEEAGSEKVTSWVGEASGNSVFMAIGNLAKVSQHPISMDHLRAVVIHERALPHLTSVFDAINRQRATRGTIWVYGTRGSIQELFESEPLSTASPLDNVIYKPEQIFKEFSFFYPKRMRAFLQSFREEAMTTTLPALRMTKQNWSAEGKSINVPGVEGVFIFKDEKNAAFMTLDKASGLQWTLPHYRAGFLKLGEAPNAVTIYVTDTDSDLSVDWKQGRPSFTLQIKAKCQIVEMGKRMSKKEIEQLAETAIQTEIGNTYKEAVKRKADPFMLELHLYRYHNRRWKQLTQSGGWVPEENSLRVKANLLLTSPGKYELDT
ncbi:Ger(x)C family spore germination protein [Paenibacillus thailandensis]|uniref:Ger(X)C family spore germination protein n=1 Tax=Paenibacillus thailandensis TaxID=393250 RepID=A0ABW5QU03_9BACL